ncbi:MAG TPA: hypothetical protein VGF79_06720 [Bacteroidia bacterium]
MFFISSFSFNLNAQYFQHVYGRLIDIGSGVSGHATVTTSPGHFMSGAAENFGAGTSNNIRVIRTDADGRFTSTDNFKNEYELSDGSGNPIEVVETRSVELSSGVGYAIVGSYINNYTGSTGMYYVLLDVAGNVAAAYEFPAFAHPRIGSLKESNIPGELYAVGSVSVDGSGTFAFILKFNISGTYMWDKTYSIIGPNGPMGSVGGDMVEDPYFPGNGLLVGTTGEGDGYILYFDLNTGNVMSNVAIYGTTLTAEMFTRIKVANNPSPGGYIIAGRAYDTILKVWVGWLINIDGASWAVNWSKTYPANSTVGDYNSYFNDVMERYNPNTSNYEYYAIGTIRDGVAGYYDMMVIKTDASGGYSGARQYTYGSPSDIQWGFYLDQNNSGMGDGFSAYGFSHTRFHSVGFKHDFYIVKSYYNGESGCQQNIKDPIIYSGPGLIRSDYLSNTDFLFMRYSDPLLSSIVDTLEDTEECYDTTIVGGSNALVANPTSRKENLNSDHMRVSTNESATGLSSINIELTSGEQQEVTVTIYDMLGRKSYEALIVLKNGINTLPLTGQLNDMSAGLYRIDITSKTLQSTAIALVK